MNLKKIFIILFAILYVCVCGVSMLHAIAFFGLANNSILSIILAVSFEIGQAAVLFSILTGNGGKNKFIPWLLMIILTTVQVMGNVFSSYKYLILNSTADLVYFKEPIFIWMQGSLTDAQCDVILSFVMGGILPLVALLLTSMVTNYIDTGEKKKETKEEPIIEEPTKVIEQEPIEDEIKQEETDKEQEFINL